MADTDSDVDADDDHLQLECPVCLTQCTSPIFMCANGHNVCAICQPNLTSCPICRLNGRPSSRNLFAERIGQNNAQSACKNAEQGCAATVKLKRMAEHLKACEFGYRCMFEDCQWRGSVSGLAEHAQNVHADHFLVIVDGGVIIFDSNDSTTSIFRDGLVLEAESLDLMVKAEPPTYSTAMLSFKENIFWYHSELSERSTFKVQIRQITSASSFTPKFAYQLEFHTPDRTRRMVYRNKVRSLDADAYSDVIFENSFVLSPFLNGDALSFRLQMFEGPDRLAVFDAYFSGIVEPRESRIEGWEEQVYRNRCTE